MLEPLFKSFSRNAWQPTFLAASTPVIGIALQGIYLLVLHQVGWMFEDDARRLVADRICEVIAKGAAWPEQCRSRISDYEQDPIFVAFYYSHAPAHLVEWARRRRSYHYLGWTVSIGAVLGICLGVCWAAWVNDVSWKNLSDLPIDFILGGTLVAVASALTLATRMQRDVDQMEAIWVLAHLDPRIGETMGVAKPSATSEPRVYSELRMTQRGKVLQARKNKVNWRLPY